MGHMGCLEHNQLCSNPLKFEDPSVFPSLPGNLPLCFCVSALAVVAVLHLTRSRPETLQTFRASKWSMYRE